MKVEDNRNKVDMKQLKDIEVGECFEDVLGRIYVKTDEEFKDGTIKCLYLNSGCLNAFSRGATVTLVNGKVVVE